MKIALVSLNPGPPAWSDGSRHAAACALAAALAGAGQEVCVFTQRGDPAQPARLTTAGGVCVEQLSSSLGDAADPAPLDADRFAAQLVARWELDAPDVVHAHGWFSGRAALAAARRLGLPLVQTFGESSSASPERRGAVANVGPRAGEDALFVRAGDRIVATSSAEVFELLGLGASPGAIKLIPSGVDLERFRPAERAARSRTAPFRIATLSGSVADAGVGDVIDALRYLRDVDLLVGLQVSADGPPRLPEAELETYARGRGMAARVSFTDRIDGAALADFLRSADAVVCTPWHDSTAGVALAAMACGLPVIVSAVGALVDVVADGMTGIHVPPRAPRQIAYAVETLKSDPAFCARLGRFGAERAAARYGWARIAAETVAVYASIVGRASRAGRSRA